jgi:tetratricopeptide (TPR) repeat protein
MKARTVALALVAVLAVYLVLVGWRGVVLAQDGVERGDAVSVLLGLAVLVFPLAAAGLVWREVRFGVDTQRLAAELDRRGDLPVDDVPRTLAGRPDAQAARPAFDVARQQAEDEPGDPAAWYRLALAYDDLGDRRNARTCMRQALRVWRSGDAEGA